MRVVRFLLLVMGMAATVAGCAQQPVAYMVYPPAGAQYPAAAIDHVVYPADLTSRRGPPWLTGRRQSGARSGSKSASNSGLCRCACRGCAGPRPRVHDGAGSCGCDDAAASSAGRDADGCAANGRRARAGSESKASACCFGGPHGGSGRRPCAPASSGGCACAGRTCCARAGTGRKAGARCFDGAYASTGASSSTGSSHGSAGGARG